jgi:DNA-binding transcriptional ArsR family regulator
MVSFELVGTDMAAIRFAVSPLNEVVLSLRSWRDPGRFPLQLPWVKAAQAARTDLDVEMLLALTDDRLWTPDFLTPCPASPLTRFEEELDLVAGTDPAVVANDLRIVHGRGRLPKALHGPTSRALARIIAALNGYWQRCFVPHWPRMRALLEGDVTYRGRQIAQRGLAEMFSGLAPSVSLRDNTVEVRLRSQADYTRPAAGGLTLLPTMWTTSASAPISPDQPAMIMYLARGVGTLWEPESLPAPAALTRLFGAARAGLLGRLASPASSTELATRLGVTTSAVNQHLRALLDCGLLVSARHGRSVLYRRSELGDRLVDRPH